ncbi:MAG: chorismate synthase [Planctomycetes bacterium]|nr:chorismate synthase [Planctomycetota bacterium]
MRWTTAGESHGPALVGLLEGFPSGFELDVARVDAELARRQGGYGRGGRMRIETDRAEVLSGLRAGRTLGSPIALSIVNRDATIERLPVPTNPRPGHADLSGCLQHGVRDPRAVLERASARETAMRVALGGVARQLLERFGVELCAHVVCLGEVDAEPAAIESAFARGADERAARRAASAFYALDPAFDARAAALVDAAKEAGDTLGGVFEVRVLGLPPGLGSYQSGAQRLTARLGGALFSIPAMKGVEFGLGFATARRRGSQAHDAIEGAPGGGGPAGTRYRRATNRAGGLEGGMTTGEPLVARVAMKPIPTLRQGLPTVEFATLEPVPATWQRSDVTSVPAASVVGEAVVALELARAFLEKFGGDSLAAVEQAHAAWLRVAREV